MSDTTRMNVDPFSLRQPSSHKREVVVSDPVNQPGIEWRFWLTNSSAPKFHKAESMKAVLIARYLQGAPGFDPTPFPAVGGQKVEVSVDLFDMVSSIWALQANCPSVPSIPDLDARWEGGFSAEQIVAMAAVAPAAWMMLVAESAKAMSNSGNDLAASVGTSSGSASSTSEATLSLSREQTDSFTASTSGSEPSAMSSELGQQEQPSPS